MKIQEDDDYISEKDQEKINSKGKNKEKVIKDLKKRVKELIMNNEDQNKIIEKLKSVINDNNSNIFGGLKDKKTCFCQTEKIHSNFMITTPENFSFLIEKNREAKKIQENMNDKNNTKKGIFDCSLNEKIKILEIEIQKKDKRLEKLLTEQNELVSSIIKKKVMKT